MSRRPRLLDLFCGGGGCSTGYHDAGFDVVGVDIVRQYEYPFAFVRADALTYPFDGFDVVHASPPCKVWSSVGNIDRARLKLFDPHVDLLTPTLERFADLSIPWVVENVPGAPMPADSVRYCGSSFGLDVRRHRLFASNVPLVAPPCDHAWQTPRFTSLDLHRHRRGQQASVVGVYGSLHGAGDSLDLRCRAMGIDWITKLTTLNQMIPPAYTLHIGRQLLDLLDLDRTPPAIQKPE